MIGSVDELQALLNVVRSAIERNDAKSKATAAGKTSRFWSEHFAARPNFPDVSEIMTFRRSGYGYGIGDEKAGDLAREQREDARKHQIFAPMVPTSFVNSIPESTFGAPRIFEKNGLLRSSNFLVNAFTTYRITNLLRRLGKTGPLRILEIGAGWGGCAYQLHHAADVESYVIVDLPENLYLSSVYLTNSLPDRRLVCLDVDGAELTAIEPGSVAVGLPGVIERLKTKFDLVLNSFSLQEMALDSVQAYMEWIDAALSEDGIFVSANSHAKAGVARPSDYGFGRFHIHHWDVFRTRPAGYFNTVPYEVVVSRRKTDSPNYPESFQNALGWLMQLGLDQDLAPLSRGLLSGSIAPEHAELLNCYDRFFKGTSKAERDAALKAADEVDRSPITPFVTAHVALVARDTRCCRQALDEACARGLTGFARQRADVLLAGLSATRRRPAALPVRDDGFDAASAYTEVAALLETGKLDAFVEHARRIVAPR